MDVTLRTILALATSITWKREVEEDMGTREEEN